MEFPAWRETPYKKSSYGAARSFEKTYAKRNSVTYIKKCKFYQIMKGVLIVLKLFTKSKRLVIFIILAIFLSTICFITFADNPLITTDYYADPSCRVFNGKMYVYGSHDIDDPDWYKMRDYHVWSSINGVKWTDHGVALDKSDVSWVDQNQDTMWAPDCVYKNGTYYFYFPAVANNNSRRIGVATSSNPGGPFHPESNYMANVTGIDPCVYFDDNGDAYMYWSMSPNVWVARLTPDLLSLATSPTNVSIQGVPSFDLIEGPWVHKYNNQIYLSVPISLTGGPEVMDYATGTSPTGPFTYRGRIFDPNVNWTIHGSIVNYNDHWYAFYHDDALSGSDHGRCWRAEEFQYNSNGTIPKLSKTIRGIGTANAYDQIQVDRYNSASSGINYQSVGGGEPRGWYVGNIANGSWVQYNSVDFTSSGPGRVSARVASQSGGGSIDVRLNSTSGTLLGTISVPGTGGSQTWTTVGTDLDTTTTGIHNLVLVFKTGGFNVNWVQFGAATGPTPEPTAAPTPNQNPIWSGGPYTLDGTTDYVELPEGITSDLYDFTIACWVNLNSLDTWTRIFDFGASTDVFMILTPESGNTGYPYFAITLSGNDGEQGIDGTGALPTGSWQHLAVVKSGNTGILYINTEEAGRNTSMTLYPADMGNTPNNYIGRSQWEHDPYLNADIDEFVIYNRALSASEISTIGSNPPDGTPTPVSTPEPTPTTTPGDVNGDGVMDIVDALLIAQYYVGLDPENFIPENADTNCDGSIDIVDALLVAQYYVGLIDSFC
jgi:hypothetical protein